MTPASTAQLSLADYMQLRLLLTVLLYSQMDGSTQLQLCLQATLAAMAKHALHDQG